MLPHLRTNCDGRRFQRSLLLHKLVHRNLIVNEPLDAGEAKAKETDAGQGEEEDHLKDVQKVNHGVPQNRILGECIQVDPTNMQGG